MELMLRAFKKEEKPKSIMWFYIHGQRVAKRIVLYMGKVIKLKRREENRRK
jgi:hypothetical protein